ncbi:putative uncharacterized protein C8orf89 homolog isoform X1 [Anolis carolinensis]|uniref:putative uncharacterized protein C8orf89 homolog isoform X1 n=1 Tax=Anolis carolinensis TaxID=28377 RepID=UPI002F2B5DEC
MSRNQPRARLEPRDLEAHDSKFPEIANLQESEHITSQPLKEQKLPMLTSDHRFLDTKVSGKSSSSCPFENGSENVLIKSKRIKQEYAPAYGLRDCGENVAMPSLPWRSERSSAKRNLSPVAQKRQGATNSFLNSSSSNDEPSLPPLYLLPPSSSKYFLESYYKSKERGMGDTNKRGPGSWKLGPLKTSGMRGGVGDLSAVRLKKHNRCSSLLSFPEVSKLKSGKCNCFKNPVIGAPPQYLQRLSELAALERETIHQEKIRKFRKTKKDL